MKILGWFRKKEEAPPIETKFVEELPRGVPPIETKEPKEPERKRSHSKRTYLDTITHKIPTGDEIVHHFINVVRSTERTIETSSDLNVFRDDLAVFTFHMARMQLFEAVYYKGKHYVVVKRKTFRGGKGVRYAVRRVPECQLSDMSHIDRSIKKWLAPDGGSKEEMRLTPRD